MYSRILCCASERFFNIPNPTKLGRTGLQESDPRKATKIMMLSTESRLNWSGTFSQDSQRCNCDKVNDLLSNLGQTPETFTRRNLFMSMFNDISCDSKDNKDEYRICESTCEKILVLGNGHLLDQVLKRSGILPRTVHKELGTILRSKCCWNLQKVGILFSVQ